MVIRKKKAKKKVTRTGTTLSGRRRVIRKKKKVSAFDQARDIKKGIIRSMPSKRVFVTARLQKYPRLSKDMVVLCRLYKKMLADGKPFDAIRYYRNIEDQFVGAFHVIEDFELKDESQFLLAFLRDIGRGYGVDIFDDSWGGNRPKRK